MTSRTEDFIEHLISMGVKAFKKNDRHSVDGRRIDRHEVVTISGVDFRFWREVGVYFAGCYLLDQIPTLDVEVCLDGNDSTIKVELDDEEQELLEQNLQAMFNEYNIPVAG